MLGDAQFLVRWCTPGYDWHSTYLTNVNNIHGVAVLPRLFVFTIYDPLS